MTEASLTGWDAVMDGLHTDGLHIGGHLHKSPGRAAFAPSVHAGTANPALGRWQNALPDALYLSMGADSLSMQGLRPGESIWQMFGQAEVDLFASVESTHCLLWFSLNPPALLGLDAMVQTWPMLHLYAFPLIAPLPGALARVILVAPFWPARVWFADFVYFLKGSPWEILTRRLCHRFEGQSFTPGQRSGNFGFGPLVVPAHIFWSLN